MAVACLTLTIVLEAGGVDPIGTILPLGKYHSAIAGFDMKHVRAGDNGPPSPTAVIGIVKPWILLASPIAKRVGSGTAVTMNNTNIFHSGSNFKLNKMIDWVILTSSLLEEQ